MLKKFKKYLFLLVVCFAALPSEVCGQPSPDFSWEQFVEEYIQYVSELEEERTNEVERYDWLGELEEIHRNPIDINTATRDDLATLHILSDEQIDSLLAKRDRYNGGFRSLGELMTVKQLNYRERAWLSQLVAFGPLPHKVHPDSLATKHHTPRRVQPEGTVNKWYGGTHDLIATFDVPTYRRAGFYAYDANNFRRKMFTGYNFAHTLRYRYNWRHRVMYGLTAQEDVGERFGAYGSKPWDYQSFYFYYKSDPERDVRRSFNRYTVAVGDYKVSLGQGLLMGGSNWSQRVSLLSGFRSETTRIRPHTGTDETQFLRGAAASMRLDPQGRWSLTAFASCRQLDGTVKGASDDNDFDTSLSDTITAWKTDGLHRTLQEIGKRHVATQWLGGGRVGYDNAWLHVGLNGAWTHYDKIYWPASRTYNKYYMRGQDAGGWSADYAARSGQCSLQGELAFDRHMNYASTAAFRWMPKRYVSFIVQERSFSHRFVSPHGHALQANSQLQNEHAIMLGARYIGIHRCEVMGYLDYAFHSHPVYLADTLSHRVEVLAQISYRPNRRWVHSIYYKCKAREQNVAGYKDLPNLDGVLLSWRSTQHVRWQSFWSGEHLKISCGLDAACYYSQGSNYDKKTETMTGRGFSLGALMYTRVTATPHKRLKVSAMMAGFSSDDYNSRCFAYEPQLQGSVSVPTFYGQGISGTILAELCVWRQLFVAGRWGMTKYFDRQEISSDISLIKSSWKNDLSLQVRCKF